MKEGSIPEDWKSSVVLPIYKGKGDPMECGSYRGIKLLEHAMKVIERIFEHRIRQQIVTDDMQFGFMNGKGTTHARTVYDNSKSFEVKVGMHQGSGLSPLLFVIVMEAISREFRVSLPWELLYADDLAVIAETEEELIKRLNERKDNVESKGMSVNMTKTKVMISGEHQKVRQKAVRWPCGVCSKGVGSNSIQCSSCQKWVHKKCSGIKGSMSKVAKSFICRGRLLEPGN